MYVCERTLWYVYVYVYTGTGMLVEVKGHPYVLVFIVHLVWDRVSLLFTAAHAMLASTHVSKDSPDYRASYLNMGALGLRMCVVKSLSLLHEFWEFELTYSCFHSNQCTTDSSPQILFCPILASSLDSLHPEKDRVAERRGMGLQVGSELCVSNPEDW